MLKRETQITETLEKIFNCTIECVLGSEGNTRF